ncbi:MAG: sugar ABC transporter permease [Chloroflexi bacterium]|nr:sugar ABC transporter permease [Chloroflexota bacterium]
MKSLTNPKTYVAYLFLLPAVAILAAGLLVPLFNAFDLSLYKWSIGIPWDKREFIGGASYTRMLTDDYVWTSLGVTLRYALWIMVLEMILGTLLALTLERPFAGVAVFRTIFILPLMVSPIVVGLIWRYLFDARVGIIDHYLEAIGNAIPVLQPLGFTRVEWLGSPDLALPALIITDIWQWTPFIFIIVLAGLQGLPSEVTEAAFMDGANWLQMTLFVKLPMLRSILLVTLLMRLIDVFRALEVIFIMTFGGPGLSTEVLSLHIYKTAFTSQELGYAAGISVLLISIILVLSLGIMVFNNPLKERSDF